MVTFGERLYELRKEKNISQEELAEFEADKKSLVSVPVLVTEAKLFY